MARKKSAEQIIAVGCLACEDPYGGKDMTNPAMTLENNPLMRNTGCPIEEAIVDRNRDRLWNDRMLRRSTTNGRVYSGIMDMRLGG